jgi:hypothetical protein
MSVAVIGTNEFDLCEPHLQHLYATAMSRIGLARILLRTGASRGCDQVAAQTALEVGGRVDLVLPWRRFEATWVAAMRARHGSRCHIEVFHSEQHPDWLASVTQHARVTERLDARVTKLYARVFGIVAPAEIVLALPLRSEAVGGTGQGIRIARALGKVVLDLRRADDRERLNEWLKGLPH